MPSNIEIKAVVKDLRRARSIAESLSEAPCQTVFQEDMFFPSSFGRLKLRVFPDGSGELIFYDRPDSTDPRRSNYQIYESVRPAQLKRVLCEALGESVVVKKKRRVYLVGQTRIHLDEIEGLGTFVEFEVVLRPGQDPREGHAIAAALMSRFSIEEGELVSCAYADLLRRKAETNAETK